MKAKVLMLSLLGAAALSFSAQAQQNVQSQNLPAHKTVFAPSKAGHHWFLDIQGGLGVLPFGKANNVNTFFFDRTGIVAGIGVGKYWSPWFSTRLHFVGGEMRGFMFKPNAHTFTAAETDMFRNHFLTGMYEFQFDLVNYFARYKHKRVFHLVPYVGVGAGYRYQTLDAANTVVNKRADGKLEISPAVDLGLIFKFRLGRRVDLNLEAQMIAQKTNFIGSDIARNGADLMALATAGLTFHLGKPEWEEVVPMDWNLVNDLNGQINSLRAENAELSKRPERCEPCPEVPAPVQQHETETILNNVVYFRLNSAKIDQNQLINIYNTAEFAKSTNKRIIVVGYADEKTGTAEYNMKISKRRAEAVRDCLVKKYGVDASQIDVEFKGSSEQPYNVNDWNRVVIMTAGK